MTQHWVFGYGSLMWRPGFNYVRKCSALVRGYHRSLCVYSHVHRGTPDRPGLVLALDRGCACHGTAFEIATTHWDDTVAYLRAREQVTKVYIERQIFLTLSQPPYRVQALTYVVDRRHIQYAGVLSHIIQAQHVCGAEGVSGRNTEYVLNTLAHLRELNIRDATLEKLAVQLRLQAALNSS